MNKTVQAAGIIFSLASLAFVAVAVHRSSADLSEQLVSMRFLFAITGAVPVYAIVLQLLGIAWHQMIVAIDGPSISFGQALAIFNKSQIYKYIPSNVMHMVGRYAMAKKAGASHSALAFSQGGEVIIILVAATVVALFFSRTLLIKAVTTHNSLSIDVLIISSLFALILGAGLAYRFCILKGSWRVIGACFRVFFLYILFILGNGVLAVVLFAWGSGLVHFDPLQIIGIAAAAWLIGFIVPGAPGGLGVREAVMITGFSAIGVPIASATAVTIGHRLVTVFGDALLALIEFGVSARFRGSTG